MSHPRLEMIVPSHEEVLEAYWAAWDETDSYARLELLNTAWTDDGVYSDPTAYVKGRQALVDHMGGFQKQFPEHTFAMSGVDSHHGKARFSWTLTDPRGTTMVAGIDFAVFAEDGRLKSITGFFGPTPPVPS